MADWDAWIASAGLATFGAICTWTGAKLLTVPARDLDPRVGRLARGSRFAEWFGARASRPRWLLRGVGAALAAAGIAVLLAAARLAVGGR